MKAEERHQLKNNDLSKALITTQDYLKEYGGRVALGIAIVILAIVLIRQRMDRSRVQGERIKSDLAYAQTQIDMLRSGNLAITDANRVRDILATIRDEASDKTMMAEALVAQGDYHWAMANYPDLPTTRPVDKPRDRAASLKDAKSAYEEVTRDFGDKTLAVVSAHFGLAAIAEDSKSWDEAKKHYDAVKGLAAAPKVFKDFAEGRVKRLDDLRQPIMVGKVPEKFEFPEPPETTQGTTTKSAATQSATAPATKPTTATTKP